MVCSRVFGFLAIAMLLAACLCVTAAANESEEKTEEHIAAEKAVEDVKELAQEALKNATELLNTAKFMKSRVDSQKTSALNAIEKMKNVSNDDTKAVAIAAEVKATADTIISLYEKANTEAENTVKNMTDMETKAKELVTKASTIVEPATDPSNDYTTTHTTVSEVTEKVKEFETEMKDKEKLLQAAGTLELQMSVLVDKVQAKQYYLLVTLYVSEIDTLLVKADNDIKKIENKKDEVNNSLKEIRVMSKKAPESSNVYVTNVIQNAEDALVTASQAVDDAKKVKKEMLNIKENANATFRKFNGEKHPENVEQEVLKVKEYVKQVAKKAPGIGTALQSAEIIATNAEERKKSFNSAFSSEKPQPITEETKDPEQTLQNPTKVFKNGLSENSTMINSEKPLNGASENSVQQTSESPTADDREKLKVENSKIVQNNFQNATKNGTKIPLVDGNLSALSALPDSSMIVSLPLLAALIASAVLH